jgi:hypothetical protein
MRSRLDFEGGRFHWLGHVDGILASPGGWSWRSACCLRSVDWCLRVRGCFRMGARTGVGVGTLADLVAALRAYSGCMCWRAGLHTSRLLSRLSLLGSLHQGWHQVVPSYGCQQRSMSPCFPDCRAYFLLVMLGP